jgi:hypothetical protein
MNVDTATEPINLTWYHGDSQGQSFRLLDAPDIPRDLTGVTVTSEVRSTLGARTALTVTVTDPTTGVVTISPPLIGLAPDVYEYDVQFDDAGAINTWIHGRIRVRTDITQ